MPISPDALFGGGVTMSLVVCGSLWKLATMLAEIRGQVRNNGGQSLKDTVDKTSVAIGVLSDRVGDLEHQVRQSRTALDLHIATHDTPRPRARTQRKDAA